MRLVLADKSIIWWIFISSSFINVLVLTPMLFMLQIFDRIFISKSLVTLGTIAAITLMFYSISAFSSYLRSKFIISLGLKLEKKLNEPLFIAAFDEKLKTNSNDPDAFLDDLTMFRQWLTNAAVFAVFDTPWIPIYVAIMFVLDPYLGLAAIVLVIIILILGYNFSKFLGTDEELMVKEEKHTNQFLYRNIRNPQTFYLYGIASQIKGKWDDTKRNFFVNLSKAEHKTGKVMHFLKQFRYLSSSIALTIGAILVLNDRLTLGAMIAASLLMTRCTAPIDSFVGMITKISVMKAAFWRLENLLKNFSEEEKTEDESVREKILKSQQLSVTNLCCSVNNGEKRILQDISFSLKAGEAIGIIGKNGSGKTTITKVLNGLIEYSGNVQFGKYEIKDMHSKVFEYLIGYLPQEHSIFTGSVAENISSMRPTNSERIIAVAQMTGIHETILRLPMGYETILNGQNIFLSGGELQRICLARAVYNDPLCIVLDEPNSALDKFGEQILANFIDTMKEKNKIIIIVTHRGSIISNLDVVLEVEDGKLKEFSSKQDYLESFSTKDEYNQKFTY